MAAVFIPQFLEKVLEVLVVGGNEGLILQSTWPAQAYEDTLNKTTQLAHENIEARMNVVYQSEKYSLPVCCMSLVVVNQLHIPMIPLSLEETGRAVYSCSKPSVVLAENCMKKIMHRAIVEIVHLVQRLGFGLHVR